MNFAMFSAVNPSSGFHPVRLPTFSPQLASFSRPDSSQLASRCSAFALRSSTEPRPWLPASVGLFCWRLPPISWTPWLPMPARAWEMPP